MDQAGVVAADPVAAIDIHRGAVGAAGVLAHIDEQAAIGWRAAVRVVVECPDLLHAGVGVGQVHRAAVGAETQAVGYDEPAQDRLGFAITIETVERAGRNAGGHVLDHGTGPETSLAVATAIVEAHAGMFVGNMGDRRGGKAAVILRGDLEQTAFHAGDPAIIGALPTGDAGKHLVPGPAVEQLVDSAPAQQLLVGYVDPVERLFGGNPYGAFTGCVAGIDNEFGLAGHLRFSCCYGRRCSDSQSKGPAATKAPPWYIATGSPGSGAGWASTLLRKISELSWGSKPRCAARWLSHQTSRLADMP